MTTESVPVVVSVDQVSPQSTTPTQQAVNTSVAGQTDTVTGLAKQTTHYVSGDIEVRIDAPKQVAVTVFETGPQGPKGDSGDAGSSTVISPLFAQNAKQGQPIYLSRANGQAGLACATSPLTALVAGLAKTDAKAAFVSDVMTSGPFVMTDWSNVIGSASLQAGANYFLDAVAGMLTTSIQTTTGNVNTYVGQAVNASTMNVSITKPITL
jgi:hypothetical protein